ncbi:hypothetical protein [Dyadobacter chenhuakuii]|uniref:Uncharacterized protein n=1 Tax=Dyadobacter chenhuakuii TaxID=2909339 RepID=A0A9X1QC69_9BACT|nr:hypothetical protein [Dyadobacter chenhuakuii]MCF2498391.1 hypothetical protein [Dyadobacter chenhuakuii]
MAIVKNFKVTALPASPVADAIYYVKGTSDTKWRVWVTSTTGVAREIDAVSEATLTAALLLKQDKFTGTTSQYVRGDGSLATHDKASVGLGNVDNTSDADKPLSIAAIAALALKANDAEVVKLTGNQPVAGIKTFASSPVVPNATTPSQAAAYGQVTAGDAALQVQIDTLNSTAASGLKYKGDINAAANPNYPSGVIGDTYIISTAGKIGGASGIDVEAGDMIIAKAVNAGGNQATVGSSWTVIQSNIGASTETVAGYIRKATTVEAEAGSSDVGAMTPLKTAQLIAKRSVRYDAAQSLTNAEKLQARTNIGASAVTDLTLQQVLTNGASAVNQTISVQGIANSQAAIASFGANGGGVEVYNGTSSATVFLPSVKGTNVGTNKAYGLALIGQGQDDYTNGAILLSGRNAAGAGEITSGRLLTVRNFTAEKFGVGFDGAVQAAGVISAVVGNSTQWNEAYLGMSWNGGAAPEW